MEFLKTNINDIITYVLFAAYVVVYIVNLFKGKTASLTLQDSLKAFVKNNISSQKAFVENSISSQKESVKESVNETIEAFKETAFRQLADEIISLKQELLSLQQSAKERTESDRQHIADQSETIKVLTEDLYEYKKQLTDLSARVTADAEANQKRYLKLKKEA